MDMKILEEFFITTPDESFNYSSQKEISFGFPSVYEDNNERTHTIPEEDIKNQIDETSRIAVNDNISIDLNLSTSSSLTYHSGKYDLDSYEPIQEIILDSSDNESTSAQQYLEAGEINANPMDSTSNLHSSKRLPSTPTEQHPFPCPHCPKSFDKRWRLNTHVDHVHAKTRRYPCLYSDCNKKFRSEYDLKRHSTTHTGQRFVCNQCDTGFASKQRIACHIRRSLVCWDRKS